MIKENPNKNAKTKLIIEGKEVDPKKLNFVAYRKKPVVIKAIDIWKPFKVQTLEGTLEGKPGDMLIMGIEGELYPCNASIFNKTYEAAKKSDNTAYLRRKIRTFIDIWTEEEKNGDRLYKIGGFLRLSNQILHEAKTIELYSIIRKGLFELKEKLSEEIDKRLKNLPHV